MKTFSFANGTSFVYDETSKKLTLASLFGMTTGHNGAELSMTAAGMAVVCIDSQRLEGAKFQYECSSDSADHFQYSATDKNKTVRFDGEWCFEYTYSLVACRSKLTNTSDKAVTVRRALPRWTFSSGDYEIYSQLSRWGAENQLQRTDFNGAGLELKARDARSTAGATPFCVVKDKENGLGAAFHVIPKGNWIIRIHSDVLSNDSPNLVLEAGLADNDLFFQLAPGESIELPEVLLQEMPSGDIRDLTMPLHRYMNEKRLPDDFQLPPIVYNSWLYRFTSFTREQLTAQLHAAKKIGCEVFVVDAGWFGVDTSWGMVGDWREKPGAPFYGNMKDFADEVRAAGLKFGFWMEPERYAVGIPVREEHPEWFPEHTSRIDILQPEAEKYLYNVLAENIRKFGAEYIKLDFNADVGYDHYGMEHFQYRMKIYDIYTRLRKEFPTLVVENCGSGSLNCDLMTAQVYNHAFISDNAHPYETLRIRQGTFQRFMPGRVYNWVVMQPEPERRTRISLEDLVLTCGAATWDEAQLISLRYVMISALLGIPGFTGELAEFSPEMLDKIAAYVKFYKNYRAFFTKSAVRMLTPADNKVTDYEKYLAFQMQDHEKEDSLVFVFSNPSSHRSVRNFRLSNLSPEKKYRVEQLFAGYPMQQTMILSGEQLMKYGMPTVLIANQHVRHSAALYRVTPSAE